MLSPHESEYLIFPRWISTLPGSWQKLAGDDKPELFLAAPCSAATLQKDNVCLDLNTFADQHFIPSGMKRVSFLCRSYPSGRKNLKESSVVGKPGDYRPLILDGQSRLYLYRYWEYEKVLAEKIKDLAHASVDHKQSSAPAGDHRTSLSGTIRQSWLAKNRCAGVMF